MIWDVGTRTPQRLLADIGAGVRDRASLLRGCARFAAGLAALLVASAIGASLVNSQRAFTLVECGALVTALLIETLIGPDVRKIFSNLGKPRTSGRPIDGP